MFLKLTRPANGKAIYVNVDLICDFYERDDAGCGKSTILSVCTGAWYLVRETPEEIMAMLNK